LTSAERDGARQGTGSRCPREAGSWAPRRAFSLVEILVALTILGIIGAVFTRIMITQGRFTDQQTALRGARTVSRQAMNILESEIRMVQDSGGIDSASTDGKTIRILAPYRFGLNCGVSGNLQVVNMLPVDSLTLAQAKYRGFAWRSNAGVYVYVFPTAPLGNDAPSTSKDNNQCIGQMANQARIRPLTINNRAGEILDLQPAQPAAPRGQAVFFFQRITYTFKASTAFPGDNGLFRTVDGGAIEEIMAPFDTSARFKYWTRGAAASVSAPPGLELIRGIDIVFAGRSQYTPLGRTARTKSTVVASIFFKNVR
jgi:prepilin-type N-terminal cleavage/methylation domain-containing protein